MPAYLLVFLLFVGFVTLFGHGLWLIFAWLFRGVTRAVSSAPALEDGPKRPKSCAQCGSPLSNIDNHCPACGLNRLGALATNLRDLKTTLRQLRALNEQGLLDAQTFERAHQCVNTRLEMLTSKPKPKPIEVLPDVLPVMPIVEPVPEPVPQPAPLSEQFNQVLEVCEDVRDLASEKKSRLVDWYDRIILGDEAVAVSSSAAPATQPESTPAPVLVAKKAPAEPRRPRRSLAEVLGAFMQDSNIVWGELIAGLVMVGSSVALVISLWKTLDESVPYFPFLIFTAITVAIFGAGLYSLSHWKLESTSRGLLTIATLLVPLNFLVMAGLLVKHGETAGGLDRWRLASEATALAAFAFLLGKAGRVLVADGRWLLALAVLGVSASALASPRLLGEDRTDLWRSLTAGLLPVVCFVAGTGGMLYRLERPAVPRRAKSLLLFLGMATFPLILALGFLVYWSQEIGLDGREAFQRISLLLAIAGVPLLTGGLLVQRVGGSAPDRGLATLRTGGTGVAFFGMAVMMAAVPLAWPNPWLTMLVCILNFVVLTIVAGRQGMPLVHLAALPCLIIGYLTAYHHFFSLLATNSGESLIAIFLSEQSATALVGLVIVLAVAAEILVRTTYRIHGVYYACAGSVLAVASLAIVNVHGISSPGQAAIVTGIYAVGGIAANLRWRRAEVDYVALALAPVATLWTLLWSQHSFSPYWGALLAVESLVFSVVAVAASSRLLTPAAWRRTAFGGAFLALLLTLAALGIQPTEVPSVSLALLALTFLILARAFEQVALTWVGSVVFLGCGLQTSRLESIQVLTAEASSIAILSHASLTLLAGVLLRNLTAKESLGERLYARPIPWLALATSLLAPVCLFFEVRARFDHLAGFTSWIALLWLVIAILIENATFFAAFQAAASCSILFGVTSWLQTRPWVQRLPDDLLDPRSLQAYGIGLAGLGLVWLIGRFLCRQNQRAERLLNPGGPSFDWTVLGVLVLGQFALAAWAIVPGVLQELASTNTKLNWPANYGYTFGLAGWLLLALLTVDLVVALWIASPHLLTRITDAEHTPLNNEQHAALHGLVLLAATAPILWAGPFQAVQAETSALCWGLSICFLAVSLLFWLRTPLSHLTPLASMSQNLDDSTTTISRRILFTLTVLPVVILTVLATLVSAGGNLMPAAAAGTFFARVGPVLAIVVPLVLICVGLVGHAMRESTAGYAFSAGLSIDFAVISGYLIGVVTSGNEIGVIESVRLLQLATIAAAAWALLVLATRPWIAAWRENGDRQMARILFTLQLQLGALGNAILLFNGLGLLVAQFPGQATWSVAVGSPFGWAAFALTFATLFWRAKHQSRLPVPQLFAGVGLAVLGLAACSMLSWQPAWAYRVLMVGWALYMPTLVVAAWLRNRRQSRESLLGPALAPPIVASWVRLIGIAVVLLGINAAATYRDHLWSACAIAVVGSAGAAMAVWRRREDWAFMAGLCVNLAASLVVWHFRFDMPFESWWLYLIQANILSAALVALLWLGARKMLYVGNDASLRSAPFLATQIVMAFGSNALFLTWPCVKIILEPWQPVPAELAPIGSLVGWAALTLAFAAAFWHAGLESRGQRGHVILMGGLLFGMLAAVSEGLNHPEQSWLAYHVLLAAWLGLGMILVVAEPLSRLRDPESPGFSPFPHLASFLAFDAKQFRNWLSVIGLLVLLLALRATINDPQRPYWSSGATLAVAVMVGATAIRSRAQSRVYFSGLLVPLACGLAWVAWYPLGDGVPWPPAAYSLGYTLLLGFAVASTIWSLVEFALRSGTPPVTFRLSRPPFVHVAAWLATILGGLLLVESFVGDLMFTGIPVAWLLPTTALAVLVLSFLVSLWDEHAPFTIAGLYAIGLLALGLGLQSLALPPARFVWLATLALASYTLLAAVLAHVLPRLDELWRALRLKPQPVWPELWFLTCQTVIGTLVVGLCLWVSLTFDSANDRFIGSVPVALLTLTTLLLANASAGRWASQLRGATLCLGVLLVVVLGWATLDLGSAAVHLHRHVLLLVSLAAMTLFEGVVLPRLLVGFGSWLDTTRRAGPVLLAITILVLVGLLGHELGHFNAATKHTPLVLWETAAVAISLVGLIASGICFAVAPNTDPYGLSEKRRPLYVYAAELLLLFLFIHIRLNVPELFGGALAKYWPLAVMGVAFIGVGLSEFFGRLGLKVLARPLQRTGVFMPLLPLLAFWVRPPQAVHDVLVRIMPGLQQPLEPLMRDQPNFGSYAIIWFSLGLLYSWVASINRSRRFALLAALAGNFGLWALLYNADLSFFSHPQVWMIPLALILLVSEHINRQELGPQKSQALRYMGLIMIYVSSTADMFLAWGENPYLPLILAALSILGVLAGILMRVTAFLYLGTSFFFVVVFSMIWHAAVDGHQMWLWWACGIGLGALIFALFAVFEKRREDVLKLIEDIKSWE